MSRVAPFSFVADLPIPRRVYEHYHFVEALACATILTGKKERVIGTTNDARFGRDRVLELYGWAPGVAPHTDGFGWVYLLPLACRRSSVHAIRGSRGVDLRLRRGAVYRLDDRALHWTRDAAPVVALYVGWFRRPADVTALAELERGLELLAANASHAPRVKQGFRCPAPWELWVQKPGEDERVVASKEEAAANPSWAIARCALCAHPAYSVDRHFPYQDEQNRCRQHFRAEHQP